MNEGSERRPQGSADSRWREIVERRREQMDAAYAALKRTSADFWSRRMTNRGSVLRRTAGEDDPTLRLLLPLADSGSTVIDVGAGAGRYALAVAPHVGRLVAVEPDEAMVPLLRDSIRESGFNNIEIIPATWQEAEVEPADLVLCAHVLYPIAGAVPFIRKLDAHARRACFLVLRETIAEPEPLGRLWRRFHGEPRFLQPGYVDAFDLLFEMGIYANVEVSKIAGPSWSYPDLDSAVAAVREHLILLADAESDAVLRTELERTMVESDGMLSLPVGETHSAVLWWEKDSS